MTCDVDAKCNQRYTRVNGKRVKFLCGFCVAGTVAACPIRRRVKGSDEWTMTTENLTRLTASAATAAARS